MPSFSKVILAAILLSTAIALPRPQLAGEGQLADAVFTDTDNAVGYGIEDAEDNIAATISSAKGGSAAPAAPASRRQLDKISNGFQAISDAAGTGSDTTTATGALDSVDGTLTSDAGNAGVTVGEAEEQTLEGAGSAVPKH